jgi:hypothetical protein
MMGPIEAVRFGDLLARASSVARRTDDAGEERLTVVLVMPGGGASRQAEDAARLGATVRLALVDGGGQEESLRVVVERHDVLPVGAPMSPSYRHQLTLRRVVDGAAPALGAAGEAIVEIALRLEALIDELARAGVVDRVAIDGALAARRPEAAHTKTPAPPDVAGAGATDDSDSPNPTSSSVSP